MVSSHNLSLRWISPSPDLLLWGTASSLSFTPVLNTPFRVRDFSKAILIQVLGHCAYSALEYSYFLGARPQSTLCHAFYVIFDPARVRVRTRTRAVGHGYLSLCRTLLIIPPKRVYAKPKTTKSFQKSFRFVLWIWILAVPIGVLKMVFMVKLDLDICVICFELRLNFVVYLLRLIKLMRFT